MTNDHERSYRTTSNSTRHASRATLHAPRPLASLWFDVHRPDFCVPHEAMNCIIPPTVVRAASWRVDASRDQHNRPQGHEPPDPPAQWPAEHGVIRRERNRPRRPEPEHQREQDATAAEL